MTLFITTANQSMYQKVGSVAGHVIGVANQIVLASGATVSSGDDPATPGVDSSYGIDGSTASSGSSLLLMGSVLSAGSTGIYLRADSYKVLIGATAAVFGGNHGILLSEHAFDPDPLKTNGSNLVENRGLVQAVTGTGIGAKHSDNTISNLGSVFATKGIVAGTFGSNNNHVVNSGNIYSTSIGVDLWGAGSSLINSGLIQSMSATGVTLQSSVGETMSIVNTGTIETVKFPSVIVGGAGSDQVINKGTIIGAVSLGSGQNLYDGRGGTVQGSITLGAGNDTVYGGMIDGNVTLDAGDDVFDGRDGSLTGQVFLGAGNDTAYGGAGTETFSDWDPGHDFVSGGDGDDFYANYLGGNDVFQGGNGIDSLAFHAVVGQSVTIDLRSTAVQMLGALGSLQLSSVENLATANGHDLLIGTSAGNKLSADEGNDTLEGGLGNDTLDGASDLDYARFTGSTGAKVNLTIAAAQDTKYGSDTFISIEGLIGGSGADSFIGNTDANTFYGNSGNDSLSGGIGADTLYGGAGKDRLTGGADADVFVFNTSLNVKTNVDTITDFKAVDDAIRLENAVFKKLGSGSAASPKLLSKSFFVLGAKAKDSNDYIVYDKATGALSYDADGSGAGAAIKVAVLTGKPTLSAADFFVI